MQNDRARALTVAQGKPTESKENVADIPLDKQLAKLRAALQKVTLGPLLSTSELGKLRTAELKNKEKNLSIMVLDRYLVSFREELKQLTEKELSPENLDFLVDVEAMCSCQTKEDAELACLKLVGKYIRPRYKDDGETLIDCNYKINVSGSLLNQIGSYCLRQNGDLKSKGLHPQHFFDVVEAIARLLQSDSFTRYVGDKEHHSDLAKAYQKDKLLQPARQLIREALHHVEICQKNYDKVRGLFKHYFSNSSEKTLENWENNLGSFSTQLKSISDNIDKSDVITPDQAFAFLSECKRCCSDLSKMLAPVVALSKSIIVRGKNQGFFSSLHDLSAFLKQHIPSVRETVVKKMADVFLPHHHLTYADVVKSLQPRGSLSVLISTDHQGSESILVPPASPGPVAFQSTDDSNIGNVSSMQSASSLPASRPTSHTTTACDVFRRLSINNRGLSIVPPRSFTFQMPDDSNNSSASRSVSSQGSLTGTPPLSSVSTQPASPVTMSSDEVSRPSSVKSPRGSSLSN